jgi:hypothetical protein
MFYAYTYGTAGWLSLQAMPLIIMPKFLVALLTTEVHRATDMEVYFGRSLGFSLVVLALIVLFFTGTIPLSSSITEPVSLEDNDPKAPYAVPIVRVLTLWQSVCLIYCYVWYTSSVQGAGAYLIGVLGYGILAAMGLWIVLFGTTAGRLSKRTGADKRTAGFPFKNEKAYDKKKDRKMI